MMNKRIKAIIAIAAVCGIESAYADGSEDAAGRFAGGYVGLKTIANWSKGEGNLATDGKLGFGYGSEAGYLWNAYGQIVGISAFGQEDLPVTHRARADGRPIKFGVDAFGADLVLGHPIGDWLIYLKAGLAHAQADDDAKAVHGNSFHGGVGMFYRVAPHWTIGAEFVDARAQRNGSKVDNESLLFRVAYHFGK
jgi:Outer membrane protein beta-barrel domain